MANSFESSSQMASVIDPLCRPMDTYGQNLASSGASFAHVTMVPSSRTQNPSLNLQELMSATGDVMCRDPGVTKILVFARKQLKTGVDIFVDQ